MHVDYDALGNITSKTGVGTYAYAGTGNAGPHAVTSITGSLNGVTNPSFAYDADGNMTSNAGRTVTYTSFNMTAQVTQGAFTTALAYDPDHAHIRMDNGASFTFYLNDAASGAMTERVNASGTVTWKSYLVADGRIVAIRSTTGGVTTMRYVASASTAPLAQPMAHIRTSRNPAGRRHAQCLSARA